VRHDPDRREPGSGIERSWRKGSWWRIGIGSDIGTSRDPRSFGPAAIVACRSPPGATPADGRETDMATTENDRQKDACRGMGRECVLERLE